VGKVEELRQALGRPRKAGRLNIFEIRYPELDANLIAENVRPAARNARVVRSAEADGVAVDKAGAKGVRVAVRRPPRRRGDVPPRVGARRPRPAATPYGPTSSSSERSRRPRTGPSASRPGLSRRHRARAAPGLAERGGGRAPAAMALRRRRAGTGRRAAPVAAPVATPAPRARWEPPRCCTEAAEHGKFQRGRMKGVRVRRRVPGVRRLRPPGARAVLDDRPRSRQPGARSHHLKRGGKGLDRVFPDKAGHEEACRGADGLPARVRSRPRGSRCQPGRSCSSSRVTMRLAKEAMRLASYKLPIKTSSSAVSRGVRAECN